MNFIQNLDFSRKFIVVGALALAMVAIPSALVLRNDLRQLNTARVQLSGMAPSDAVLQLVRLTQQHRGLSALVLGGADAAAANRQAKQQEVQRALEGMQQSLGALADDSLQAGAKRLASDWQALAAAVAGKSLAGPESLARHTALIARQLDLLQDVTRVAGIVHISEPAAYYLQDGVLTHLPRLTETMGQLRARGALVLARAQATPEERARIEALAGQAQAQFVATRRSIEITLNAEPDLVATLSQPLQQAVAAAEQMLALVDQRIVQAQALDMPSKDYFDATTKAIDQQFALVQTAFEALRARVGQDEARARNELLAVSGAVAALAALALWFMVAVTRSTTASMKEALRVAQAVAGGDLSVSVPSAGRDEVGQLLVALRQMKESLARVVGSVRSNADSVATASAQIAQGNQDLSQRTEQQAGALQQTASSMEQLGSTVRQNADSARQARQLAHSAAKAAVAGGEVVGRVVGTMRGINDSSRKVADIIGVIDGIAFQTNILALNAAVEAARAGAQGLGFAVVAGEVRSLAQRSAGAAREIKRLITASVEQVEQGSGLVDQAGATMHQVVDAIQRVTDVVAEISLASGEQSTGVTQVGEAMAQMDRATQQNAALVEESAAAAASLKAQAQQLVDAVAVFRLDSEPETAPAR